MRERFIIIGNTDVSSILLELNARRQLKGEIVAMHSSIVADHPVMSFSGVETLESLLGYGLAECTALYAGGEIDEFDLMFLKEHCKVIYDVSISYADMLAAERLGIAQVSYTRFVTVRNGIYYPVIKRLLDIIISGLGIIIASPIMLVVAFLVRVKLGSPVTFSQIRPGKNERVFFIHKFRSMSNAKDENGELLPDDVRLTKFGKVLRSTSLDELPQLFSIFSGKMSLIGPRPQSFENVYFMTARQRLRHAVTPGLTGWSQVNGRNAIPWDEKIQYDLDYVEQKITFARDAKIFFRTVAIVLLRKNITQVGSVSTESVGEFRVRTNMIGDTKYHQMRAEAREWEYRKAAEIKRGGDPHE